MTANRIETAEALAEAAYRYRVLEAVIAVRDASPRLANDADSEDIVDAVIDIPRPPVPAAGLRVTREAVEAASRDLLRVDCIEDDANQRQTRQPNNIREARSVTHAVLAALGVTVAEEVSDRG